ncbi:MAG: MerR family transcriptional regulator [Acidimicrobiia bacterium]|nr:MerR family transcriptional regulator [Acidimicrobiia bacterium]
MAESHTIGGVIALLREEFPDVTVSKLRFLEGQNLIRPSRTKAGYRQFSDADLERIRYILRQQRDHYLPLKVIKSKLTAWERGEDSAKLPEGPPPETYFAESGVSMSASELAKAAGLGRRQLANLVEHGLLTPMKLEGGKEVFRDDDLVIARAAARLVRHGLEGRHLRSFRLSVDREVDLLRQLTEPMLRHRNPENRRRAAEILADSAQAGRELSEALLRGELRDLLGQ